MEAFTLIADLGFSIAAVIGGGFFIILLLKYILDSVVGSAKALNGMLMEKKMLGRIKVKWT